MTWYKPWTWGQTEPVPQAAAVMEPPVVDQSVAPSVPVGGRRRKTQSTRDLGSRRRGRKGTKKSRSGRKSTH